MPTAGGVNADLALQFAAAYAEAGSDVTLFHVATDGDVEEAKSSLADKQEALAESDVNVDIDVEEAEEVVETILHYAREQDFDSIIVGAAGEGILRRVMVGEIPETVGEKFEGEVVMVQKHRPVQSAIIGFIRKWVGKGARATNLDE